MKISYRIAAEADALVIQSLIHQLEHPIELPVLLNNIQEKSASKDYRIFVATVEENVVAVGELHFEHFVHEKNKRARITVFCVEESFRNRKVGASFLQFMESVATDAGVSRMELTSNMRRKHAHRFYENNGYIISSKVFFKNL
jgi:GNAT superfamily N-acetyltransferase